MPQPTVNQEYGQRRYWFELKRPKGNEFRARKIMEMFPPDAKSCLDVGPATTQFVFRKRFDRYETLDLYNANYNVDLLYQYTLPIANDSYDIVILSHVLEHLPFPNLICLEARRISKKYIYIALPNEYSIFSRFRFLMAVGSRNAISLYGHKFFFSVYSADKWVSENLGKCKRKRISSLRTGILQKEMYYVGKLLVKIDPNLFGSEVAYLFDKSDLANDSNSSLKQT